VGIQIAAILEEIRRTRLGVWEEIQDKNKPQP